MSSEMSFPQQLLGRALSYSRPIHDLCYFFYFLPATAIRHPITLITSPSTFQREWFSAAWSVLGPLMASNAEQAASIASLVQPNTHGVVLELGPGGGDQMSHFIPLFESGTITRIYAAEPNEFLHAKLRASARQAGLSDSQYIILHAGGEPSSLLPALSSTGLLTSSSSSIPSSGIFDTILSIRVLCSFTQSDLESTLLVSQALLKPSGKLVFYEHIGNVKDKITQIYVWFLMFIWPIACGGCRLDCKLDLVLNEMTGWKEKKLVEAQGVMDWAVFRFIQGWAQKE